jgi:uncharacterized membrane protein HdeD (DUF308 family)
MSKPASQPQWPGMVKAPNSLRVAQIVVGIITLVLAGLVVAFPVIAIFLIAVWLSISLLFGGIEEIIVGAGARHLSKRWRAISIGIGAVAIALSVTVFAFPGAATRTLIFLLSIALLFLGTGEVAKGVSEKHMAKWARGMLIAVGILTIGLSSAVVIFPGFGFTVLYVLVAAALIVNGASYVVSGITGVIFRPMSIGRGSDAKRKFWKSDTAA